MIDLFRRSRREALPSTPLLDEINVTTLREDPDLLEKVIVGQHQQAASNESVADLLRSIFLLPDRDADFGRFASPSSSPRSCGYCKHLASPGIKP